MISIPFNKAYLAGRELEYISRAVENGEIKGDGDFTRKCNEWIERNCGARKALLTTSCTAALEMAAILVDIDRDSEVIMSPFTFVSTANAFVLRGARIVFVDIRPDTLNIDEKLIEAAITPNTKCICPMHYGGVGCEMDIIMKTASDKRLAVVEDAAHAVTAKYRGRHLGTIGDIGAFSFHETKNFSAGEGGAILVNRADLAERAEIIREKGTDRTKFFRGEIDKYTWVDIGSSYLPSEIVAAFLYAQLEEAEMISATRMRIWRRYYEDLAGLADAGKFVLPTIPDGCEHNAHLFYIILNSGNERDGLMQYLRELGILAVFHYIPLHHSRMGELFCPDKDACPVAVDFSQRILRLPFYNNIMDEEQARVIKSVKDFFEK